VRDSFSLIIESELTQDQQVLFFLQKILKTTLILLTITDYYNEKRKYFSVPQIQLLAF
jgi:hypothetical protein